MGRSRFNTRERIVLLALSMAYVLFLVHAYIYKVVPVFGYMGCELVSRPAWVSVAAIAWAILPVSFLPILSERASALFLWILYVIVFIPSMTIPMLSLNLDAWNLMTMQTLLTAGFWVLTKMASRHPKPLPKAPVRNQEWIYLIAGLLVISLALLVPVLGLSFKVHSYADIYLVRADLKDEFENSSVIVGYLIPWMAYAVIPLVTAQCLIQRRWNLLAVAFFCQAYLFFQTGHKTYLLPFIVLPVSLWGFRKMKGRMPRFILGGMLTLFVIAYLLDAVTHSPLATSLIIRRAVVTPGQLTGMYFEFFSHHPRVWFSNNLLKPILNYPYPAPVPFIIGDYYFNAPEMSANANVWADAFANMGSLGILIFSALLGWILWMYDRIVRAKWPDWIGAILFIVPALSLTNSALFTCLLTHGVGLFLLLSWLMPKTCLIPRQHETPSSAKAGR